MDNDYLASEDDLYRLVTIDKDKKVKITISLKDANGGDISIKETIRSLTEWVDDKLKSTESSSCRHQIYPLMAQSMAEGMIKLLGINTASLMLSSESIRYSIIHMMTVGFYLLKFIQRKNIKVFTNEEPLTDQDILTYERISKASNLATMAHHMGLDPKTMVKTLIKQGKLP